MLNDDVSRMNRRFDKVVRIIKYDPICGNIWPKFCHDGVWDRSELLYSSDDELDKILYALDDMYGETMSIGENSQYEDLFLSFFENHKHIIL